MNYSLSSVRKIDDYKQKIITTWTNAPSVETEPNILNKMKAWHLLVDDLDYTGWDTGVLNYKSMISSGSGDYVNNGNKADVFFTFKLKKDIPELVAYPTYIQVKFETDNGVNVMYDQVDEYLNDLIGIHAGSRFVYPVNVIINMKNLAV